MSNSNQSFFALMLGVVLLAVTSGLDAFIFHRFGILFDELVIVGYATACGIHWAAAPKLPLG